MFGRATGAPPATPDDRSSCQGTFFYELLSAAETGRSIYRGTPTLTIGFSSNNAGPEGSLPALSTTVLAVSHSELPSRRLLSTIMAIHTLPLTTPPLKTFAHDPFPQSFATNYEACVSRSSELTRGQSFRRNESNTSTDTSHARTKITG
jgi:hypothetical protein